jgi:tetratricopeptide (TPR) repeat protein
MIPSKFELLTRMFEMQRNVSSFMIGAQMAGNSNNLTVARENYEKQIESGKKHLELALLHNDHYPPPVEIVPIVRVMIDALLMLADTIQNKNELRQANLYRDEAVKLSESFLSSGAKIEIQRSLAASYTAQGRFNEALTLLSYPI